MGGGGGWAGRELGYTHDLLNPSCNLENHIYMAVTIFLPQYKTCDVHCISCKFVFILFKIDLKYTQKLKFQCKRTCITIRSLSARYDY